MMPISSPPTADRPAHVRSRVTNGRALFVEGDERSPWARRFRDLVAAHVADLGGADMLTEGQRALIRRSATLAVELEAMEGSLSRGEEVDLDLYGRLAGHQRRILETIGLERRARDATLDLRTYMAEHAAKAKGEEGGR